MNRTPLVLLHPGAALACLVLLVSPADGRGNERDTSFLVPGKTTFQEVEEHWHDGSLFEDPDLEFDTDLYREKPHVHFIPELHVEPVPPTPDGLYSTELVVAAEEAAKWTRVSVRVIEYCRFLSTSAVTTSEGGAKIVLVFTKDANGKPDRLLYYKVSLLADELDWDRVLREQSTAPTDTDYHYIKHWDDHDDHQRYRFRRFPKRGVGYVWNRSEAEAWGEPAEAAEKIHYCARVHFEPTDK